MNALLLILVAIVATGIALVAVSYAVEEATEICPNIEMPVLLVWGERDWSNASEREREQSMLRTPGTVTVPGGGHFLPLDRPVQVIEALREFYRRRVASDT